MAKNTCEMCGAEDVETRKIVRLNLCDVCQDELRDSAFRIRDIKLLLKKQRVSEMYDNPVFKTVMDGGDPFMNIVELEKEIKTLLGDAQDQIIELQEKIRGMENGGGNSRLILN